VPRVMLHDACQLDSCLREAFGGVWVLITLLNNLRPVVWSFWDFWGFGGKLSEDWINSEEAGSCSVKLRELASSGWKGYDRVWG